MIVYVDSSAAAKKYIDEPGSEKARRLLGQATVISTSLLTVVEMISFLERSKRERRIDSPTYRRMGGAMEKDLYEIICLVGMDQSLIREAARIVRQRRLRTQDAIQLASALATQRNNRGELEFICADRRLLEAARLEGLKCQDVS